MIRTSLLAAAGFNSKALAGESAAVPAVVQSVLLQFEYYEPHDSVLVIALLVHF